MADLLPGIWPDLGPYARAVLGSYGVGIGILGAVTVFALRANARARAELEALERRGGPRR